MRVIIVGGGWAGVAAAYEAKKCGAEVILIEKTDMLLGTGLVGGIIRNNGRFTIFEELKAMGLSELIEVIDNTTTHQNIDFPGHKHASFYDVTKIEKVIIDLLEKIGVKVILKTRISKVNLSENKIINILSDNDTSFEGDVFIDATGTAGPLSKCIKYGNGCSMCLIKCSVYKGRISLTSLCGVNELQGKKSDGSIGSMSGSCKLSKESLSIDIVDKLNKNGVISIPLDEKFSQSHLDIKACQQYALKEYQNNLILIDTGHVKLMVPYYSLNKLKKIKGFEKATYLDPLLGDKGNSMRLMAISPYDNKLKVKGINNLLCVGEKTGLIGHTEAILTGALAGYNAVRLIVNKSLLELPRETICGETIAYTNEQLNTEDGLSKKYTASGSILFDRLKDLDLYVTDVSLIKEKIKKLNLDNIF